jgi:hypothetical protein
MDLETEITESLERLYPVPVVTADWGDVLDRARPRLRSRIATLFPPMTMRRRLGLLGGIAVVIGASLLVGSMFGKRTGVLERAQAALDPNGRILHIVVRWGDGPRARRGEEWFLPDGSLDHVVYRSASGAVGADCVISVTQTRCWNPALDVIDLYQHLPPEPGYPRVSTCDTGPTGRRA